MSHETLVVELAEIQSMVLTLASGVDDAAFRQQYHPDLSPIGWHLGHCVFVECYWLHEQVRGDDSITAPISTFYTPPLTPKAERGARLPRQHDLLAWARELTAFNLNLLRNLRPEWQSHELFDDDYLLHFLIQHYCQHYETLLMILTQKALGEIDNDTATHPPLQPAAPAIHSVDVPAGHYRIGGERPIAYDNEVPPQQTELAAFSISRRPVSNAEYLYFMESGSYQTRALWSDAGWHWCESQDDPHPEHWRRNDAGHWYAVDHQGSRALSAEEPVSGINHHEASAYARWAEASLPHEYQWEAACRIGALEQTGHAWEWCHNTFHPYAGFTSFPYEDYSTPWFNDQHYSLRGGSLHTRPPIKRPSFRNFFEADKRHVFAGLRLTW